MFKVKHHWLLLNENWCNFSALKSLWASYQVEQLGCVTQSGFLNNAVTLTRKSQKLKSTFHYYLFRGVLIHYFFFFFSFHSIGVAETLDRRIKPTTTCNRDENWVVKKSSQYRACKCTFSAKCSIICKGTVRKGWTTFTVLKWSCFFFFPTYFSLQWR